MYQAAIRRSLRGYFPGLDGPGGAVTEESHFTVELVLGRAELTREGEVADREVVASCLGEVLAEREGRPLNDADWFDRHPATPENLAAFLAEEVADRLVREGIDPAGFARFELRLWVSQGSWASYSRESSEAAPARTEARRASAASARTFAAAKPGGGGRRSTTKSSGVTEAKPMRGRKDAQPRGRGK